MIPDITIPGELFSDDYKNLSPTDMLVYGILYTYAIKYNPYWINESEEQSVDLTREKISKFLNITIPPTRQALKSLHRLNLL